LITLVNHDDRKVLITLKTLLNKTKSEECVRYPEEKDILTDNTYWQVLQHPSGIVKILNAYVDTRPFNGWNSTVVRISVLISSATRIDYLYYCQFWYDENSKPTVVKASEVDIMWGNYRKN
jgi:hypothetical protein